MNILRSMLARAVRVQSGIRLAVSRHYAATIAAAASAERIGFIGLGHMGGKMVENMKRDGKQLLVFDLDSAAVAKVATCPEIQAATSVLQIAKSCSIVFSMLPNDKAVQSIAGTLLRDSPAGRKMFHISCSTISPVTSRALAAEFSKQGKVYISAPVFARPDGIAKRQATWMLAGDPEGKRIASDLLSSAGKVIDYGTDVGASNVVKLCGNFLIAASIEAISESMALAEKHGVDRKDVMTMLSSSIFDCLIYKGYGQRVSHRDHRPGGFSLALGLKDCTLVNEAARQADVPMPFLSVLLDRYTSAKAKGRADFDWSAIGLGAAEDAGIDVSADVARNRKDCQDGNNY